MQGWLRGCHVLSVPPLNRTCTTHCLLPRADTLARQTELAAWKVLGQAVQVGGRWVGVLWCIRHCRPGMALLAVKRRDCWKVHTALLERGARMLQLLLKRGAQLLAAAQPALFAASSA